MPADISKYLNNSNAWNVKASSNVKPIVVNANVAYNNMGKFVSGVSKIANSKLTKKNVYGAVIGSAVGAGAELLLENYPNFFQKAVKNQDLDLNPNSKTGDEYYYETLNKIRELESQKNKGLSDDEILATNGNVWGGVALSDKDIEKYNDTIPMPFNPVVKSPFADESTSSSSTSSSSDISVDIPKDKPLQGETLLSVLNKGLGGISTAIGLGSYMGIIQGSKVATQGVITDITSVVSAIDRLTSVLRNLQITPINKITVAPSTAHITNEFNPTINSELKLDNATSTSLSKIGDIALAQNTIATAQTQLSSIEVERHDYETKPQSVSDLYGNTIATATPRDFAVQKSALDVKIQSDENDFDLDFDDIDFFAPFNFEYVTDSELYFDYIKGKL